MCGSMADIQSAAAEIRRGKKRRRKKERTNHSMKIYMVSLFHRATINQSTTVATVTSVTAKGHGYVRSVKMFQEKLMHMINFEPFAVESHCLQENV